MHIAQRKKLDVHKTKRKRGINRTTTSLVLDSSMQRGRWEFRLNQRIWLRLSSVFESRRISFLKIFLFNHCLANKYVNEAVTRRKRQNKKNLGNKIGMSRLLLSNDSRRMRDLILSSSTIEISVLFEGNEQRCD